MNRLALAAVATLAATALTGAAVVPAAGDTKVHTKTFVSHQTAFHFLGGQSTFAAAGVDRHAGHVIGYDSHSSHDYLKKHLSVSWISFALKNGTIGSVIRVDTSAGGPGSVFTGRIVNGTGRYKGIKGTVAARPAPHNTDKTFFTLTYHF